MFNALSGRKVLVTGHTGFCGSWLSRWLSRLGADVYGVSLAPKTQPNLFEQIEGWTLENSFLFDLATPNRAVDLFEKIAPEIVFHLAAQPLVRQSYADTPENWRSNVMGTVEVLEAIRRTDSVRAAVMITTDKVYENVERDTPYTETDRLGGKDPYSASKSACEMAITSYRDTIFDATRILCASARGGNIIGGGDWSDDRLIPDIVRSLVDDTPLKLRNPSATRPWQHVLALCHGYLEIAAHLLKGDETAASAWNLGPVDNVSITTSEIIDLFGAHWQTPNVEFMSSPLHEAGLLALDSRKAIDQLGWRPGWATSDAIAKTAKWYQRFYQGIPASELIDQDIDAYMTALDQPG